MSLNTTSMRQTSLLISVLSVIPHLFCCGLPVVVALIALGTTAGLSAALSAQPLYHFIDKYHEVMLTLAIVSVTFSAILTYIAYRIDCRKSAISSCNHGDCAPKKNNSFKILIVSFVLLALDLSWFATEKYVLNLHSHNHDHDAHEEGSF